MLEGGNSQHSAFSSQLLRYKLYGLEKNTSITLLRQNAGGVPLRSTTMTLLPAKNAKRITIGLVPPYQIMK